MRINKILIILIVNLCPALLGAQTQEEKIQEQIRDAEVARNAEIMRVMDQGIELMEMEDYQEADIKFRNVLRETKRVPSDLCFYFGKNSYHLGKFQQSIDWLNKYIELKGTQGRFYEQCSEYLEKSKQGFLEVRNEERKAAEVILTTNYDIDCGPTGKVICPVCQGKGVIIQKGAFGNTYKSCPYSDDHGLLTCEEYNQLLRGELKPKF